MEVVVFDSLYNATREALNRVEKLTGNMINYDIGPNRPDNLPAAPPRRLRPQKVRI